jgi:hypothetical protein
MANKTKRNSSKRRSLKGKWGHIGAPPKNTRWPKRPFTMATLFARNSHQCELSLRNKVEAGVNDGSILELKAKKQPHGNVGRPKSVFVLKANYDKATMVLADKTTKTPRTPRKAKATPATVAVAPAVPATAPVAASPVTAAPVASADAPAPAPAPAPETTPVSAAPAASPATPEPAPVS